MLLADVCGFGSLFPAIAGRLRELMQKNVNSVRQADFEKAMAGHLGDASVHGGYVSAQISTYFATTRSYTLCNLGHPPPLLFRARTRKWSVLKPASARTSKETSKRSPGLVDASEYQHFKTRLESGDTTVSFSNALTECLSHDGKILGTEGILRLAERLKPVAPAQLASDLISQVEDEHADNLANVDLTVLACQATDHRVSWKDNLLAPLRLLQAAADRTNLHSNGHELN